MSSKDNISARNIKRRLRSKTPDFWKNVRKLMIGVGSVSGVILASAATGGIALPIILSTALQYGVVVGAAGTALASLTTESQPNEKAESTNADN